MGQPSAPGSWPSPDQPTPGSAVPDGGAPQQGWSPEQQGWAPQQQVPQQEVPQQQGWSSPTGGPAPIPQATQQPPQGYAQQSSQSMYGVRPEQQQPQQTQQGGYGQFTFPAVPKQKIEPLAIAGIATSPLGPVGIALGLLARGRVKQTRRRSMSLAWTGVALGAVFTIVWGLTAGILASNGSLDHAFESPEAGDVSSSRTIASANLAEGNCVATLPPAEQVGEVRLVPCAEEHIAQVIGERQLDGTFPGAEALATQATEECSSQLAAIDTGDAAVAPWYLVPSEDGWGQGNTRIVCLLRGEAGPLTVDLVNS